ncbi:hypothetical protein COCOBI_07-3520 [Coccomyxa sp. Obi]|nr:hypothetical protein COCOBI_07-3520 [Coccomyxa sp. Obi]
MTHDSGLWFGVKRVTELSTFAVFLATSQSLVIEGEKAAKKSHNLLASTVKEVSDERVMQGGDIAHQISQRADDVLMTIRDQMRMLSAGAGVSLKLETDKWGKQGDLQALAAAAAAAAAPTPGIEAG